MSKQLKDYLHLYLGCEVEYDGIVNGKELKAEKEANKHDVFYIPQVKEITGKKRGFLRRIDVRMDGSLSKVMVGRKGLKSFWGNPDFKLILRPLSDMTDSEINDIVSIMLGREVTCGRIWRSEDKDFIIADFKQEKPLPPYNEKYKSMSMGVYIKGDFQVDYKWNYYTEENCEGSCGVTDEPLHNHNEITRYMLSKHFDLFGLIDAGLAIDKTKVAVI